jgi:hypothetical protein
MGETIKKATKLKDVQILKQTLIHIFKWKESVIETITPQDEKEGKSLNVGLYGGVLKENGVQKTQVVLRVKKQNLTDKEGRRAVFSDFAVTRSADGTLSLQSDKHNFDSSDVIEFLTPEMLGEVQGEYVKAAIDTHSSPFVSSQTEWEDKGETIEKTIEIDEDDIPNIPTANYI